MKIEQDSEKELLKKIQEGEAKAKMEADKKRFMDEIVPEWDKKAKEREAQYKTTNL